MVTYIVRVEFVDGITDVRVSVPAGTPEGTVLLRARALVLPHSAFAAHILSTD